MSYFKDRTFILIFGVLLIIILLLAGLYISSNYSITGAEIQKNSPYSNISLDKQQKKVVDIALDDKNVQGYLNGRRYAITQAVMQNSNISTMGPYVLIECLNDDGSLDFRLLISVDVQNKSVISAIAEKPRPQR